MKGYILVSILVISILSLILGGCASSSTTTSSPPQTTSPAAQPPPQTTSAPSTQAGLTPKRGGTLRIGNSAGPPSLLGWPAESQGEASRFQAMSLEPLVKSDGQGNIIPWLATDYSIAPDKKSITFTLRKGVKFHDGSDFNAEVVKFNWDAVIAAKKQGTSQWGNVEILDDYTVRIGITTWQNTVLGSFGEAASWFVSKAAYDKNGVDWVKNNMIGTGPFKFVSFERDVAVKYVRNDNYWQTGKPYLDALEYLVVADPITQVAMMKTGEMDVIMMNAGKTAYDMTNIPGIKAFKGEIGVVPFNPDSVNPDSPLYHVKVRQAVEYAIDKESLASTLSYGLWGPAYLWSRPGNMSYDETIPQRKFDPEKAKQLLAEAGYPNGFQTKILSSPMGLQRDAVVAIQSYLSKVGIKADLEFPEMAAFFKMRTTGWNNALLTEGSPIGANPVGSYNLELNPGNHWQEGIYKSPELLKLLEDCVNSEKPEAALTQKLVRYVWENALVIPINYLVEVFPMKEFVMDPGFHNVGNVMYWQPENCWLNK